MSKLSKWAHIPEAFKALIRSQYNAYADVCQERGLKKQSWKDWLERQGYTETE